MFRPRFFIYTESADDDTFGFQSNFMDITKVFINRYGRLRSGWRLAIFLLALFLLSGVFGGIFGAISYYLPIGFAPTGLLGFLIPQVVLLTLAIFIGWLCGKYLEGLPFRALGAWFTKNWLKDFGLGLLFGAASIGLAALITIIFGATTFQYNATAGSAAILSTLAVSLGVFTFGAAAEEAFFRGYILQTFARANLVLFAVFLTSLLFAVTHTNNPSANYLFFVNTALAVLWFAAAYLKTRTLLFATGLHLAWNWVQGAFLGISVSGINEITIAPLLQPTNVGSAVLTGGDYGIEGGIACTIALIASTIAIWFAPILKPTEEMLKLTSREESDDEEATRRRSRDGEETT
jgi:membrane protease YdiL (CAAX protease family)